MSLTPPSVFSQGSGFDPLGIDDGTPHPDRAGDATAPSKPTVVASTRNFHEVDLTFSAPADNVGVTSRVLSRDGAQIAVFLSQETDYRDSHLAPGTQYSYTLVDTDHMGNDSPISDAALATTIVLPIRVNCGGVSDFVDGSGRTFYADTGFLMPSAGNPTATTRAILRTADDELYQSLRDVPASPGGNLKYALPLAAGAYTLRLYFAELDLAAADGSRVMDIHLDGVPLEAGVDVFKYSGGVDQAFIHEYSFTADGQVDLEIIPTAGRPFLSALEVGAPPATPVNLAAGEVTEDAFDLSCDAVPGAIEYHWYINNSLYQVTSGPTLHVPGRTPDSTYNCKVLVRNSDLFDSPFSTTLAVLTAGHVPPDAPINLAVTATTATTLSVSCDSVVGAVQYDWYLDGSLHSSSASPTATLTGLTPGTSYSLTATAVDAVGPPTGVSASSLPIAATTDASNLTAPANLAASSITQSQFLLTCDPVAGATGYDWHVDNVLYQSTISPTVLVTGRSADTAYTCKVRAIDSVPTQGPFSGDLVVTTQAAVLPAKPVNLTASNITTTTFDLTCDAAAGAVAYNWYLNGAFFGSTVPPTLSVSGRAPGSTESWAVLGESSGGLFGPLSDTLQVSTAFLQAQNLTASNIEPTEFALSCDAVSGAVLYHWAIDGVPYASTVAPSVAVSGRTQNTSYACTVQAESASGVLGPIASLPVLTRYRASRLRLPDLRTHAYMHPAGSFDMAAFATPDRTIEFLAEQIPADLVLTDTTRIDQVRIL